MHIRRTHKMCRDECRKSIRIVIAEERERDAHTYTQPELWTPFRRFNCSLFDRKKFKSLIFSFYTCSRAKTTEIWRSGISCPVHNANEIKYKVNCFSNEKWTVSRLNVYVCSLALSVSHSDLCSFVFTKQNKYPEWNVFCVNTNVHTYIVWKRQRGGEIYIYTYISF